MENFRDHKEIAQWQQCERQIHYIEKWLAIAPLLLVFISSLGTFLTASGILVVVWNTLFAGLSVGSSAIAIWLFLITTKPEQNTTTELLKSMGVPPPSLIECIWFLSRYRIRLALRREQSAKYKEPISSRFNDGKR